MPIPSRSPRGSPEDHRSREGFDVAILDVNVAGTRVWSVAHALLRRHVPFLFLSACGRQLQRPDGMQGAPLLDKPVAIDELECALVGLTLPAARSGEPD